MNVLRAHAKNNWTCMILATFNHSVNVGGQSFDTNVASGLASLFLLIIGLLFVPWLVCHVFTKSNARWRAASLLVQYFAICKFVHIYCYDSRLFPSYFGCKRMKVHGYHKLRKSSTCGSNILPKVRSDTVKGGP